jgi:hypothetical protein
MLHMLNFRIHNSSHALCAGAVLHTNYELTTCRLTAANPAAILTTALTATNQSNELRANPWLLSSALSWLVRG